MVTTIINDSQRNPVNCKESEFNGSPTIIIHQEGSKPEIIGIDRVRRILAVVDQMRAFAERHKDFVPITTKQRKLINKIQEQTAKLKELGIDVKMFS